jgi:hypothetical protein
MCVCVFNTSITFVIIIQEYYSNNRYTSNRMRTVNYQLIIQWYHFYLNKNVAFDTEVLRIEKEIATKSIRLNYNTLHVNIHET